MNKFCVYCGKQLEENTEICLNCGKKNKNGLNNNKMNEKSMEKLMKAIILIPFILVIVLVIVRTVIILKIEGNAEKEECYNNGGIWQDRQCEMDTLNNDSSANYEKHEINKPFQFDNLEITINNDFTFTTMETLKDETVVIIPVTIKNITENSHSLYPHRYKFYGPKGAVVQNVSAFAYATYSLNETVDFSLKLKPGESDTKKFFIVYDGNGDYYLRLNNSKQKIEIKIPINK